MSIVLVSDHDDPKNDPSSIGHNPWLESVQCWIKGVMLENNHASLIEPKNVLPVKEKKLHPYLTKVWIFGAETLLAASIRIKLGDLLGVE